MDNRPSTGVLSTVEYPGLALFFLDLPDSNDRVTLTMSVLSHLAHAEGDALPPEALLSEWWTNGSAPQTSSWRVAGWEVDLVVPGAAVGFRRALSDQGDLPQDQGR